MNIEETTALQLDFTKLNGVIPVAVQDSTTREVILIAYTNEQALRATQRMGELVLWSTSRNELWHKGAGSGNTFAVLEIRCNCEQNSLVYLVRPNGGGMCHTQNAAGSPRRTCYYRRVIGKNLDFLEDTQ